MAEPLELGDAIKAALNGYKADVMSRAEAVITITNALINQCKTCRFAGKEQEISPDPYREVSLNTTWGDD